MTSRDKLKIITEKAFVHTKDNWIPGSEEGTDSWVFDFKKEMYDTENLNIFLDVFFESISFEKFQVGGLESSALPLLGAITAAAGRYDRKVNSFFLRKSRKKDNLFKSLEGEIVKELPIVLLDDILNSGRSFNFIVESLEMENFKVSEIFTILRYRGLDSYKYFIDKSIKVKNVFDLNDFQDSLKVQNLNFEELKVVKKPEKAEWVFKPAGKVNLNFVLQKSGICLDEGFVYKATDDGTVYCLNKNDGSVFWKYNIPFSTGRNKFILSSLVVYKSLLFIGTYTGSLFALNVKTGEPEWVFSDADWIGSTPCINEEKNILYIGLEFGLQSKKGGLVAIDIFTGEVIWRNYNLPDFVHASPKYSIKSNLVFCGSNDKKMRAFNANTGEIVWAFETAGEIKQGVQIDEIGNQIFFGSFDGFLYSLDMFNGKLKWKHFAEFNIHTTPVLYGDKVFYGGLNKIFYTLNKNTGEEIWSFRTAGRIFSDAVVVERNIIFGNNEGIVYVLDFENGKEIAKTFLRERIVNKSIFDEQDNSIYIGTQADELYKIKKWW